MTTQIDVPAAIVHSKIDPLPYFPMLCRVLGGVTISIVLVYLEIHHSASEPDPATQPARAGLRMPAVALDCDQACEDLGVSRRTLDTALQSLGVWWKEEPQRSAAARSGREFLNSVDAFPPSTLSKIKPYAIVGSHVLRLPTTLAIHRNYSRIDEILTLAGILKPIKSTHLSETSAAGHSMGSPGDVLGNALGLQPMKAGIAWGWSDERRREASERMTRKWLRYRELASK